MVACKLHIVSHLDGADPPPSSLVIGDRNDEPRTGYPQSAPVYNPHQLAEDQVLSAHASPRLEEQPWAKSSALCTDPYAQQSKLEPEPPLSIPQSGGPNVAREMPYGDGSDRPTHA